MFPVLGLIGIAVLVLGLGIFLGLAPEPEPLQAKEEGKRSVGPSRFFAGTTTHPVMLEDDSVPAELVLSRLERHVRQEKAAVEGFLYDPSVENLRCKTTSSLVN